MANNITTSNPKNNSSLKHDEINKESVHGIDRTAVHEEKKENIKPITDKELERSIFKGWESPNVKNATTTEIELAKLHWGFVTAMDNYFFVSRDPEQFAKTLHDAGFSHDWPRHERQIAIARLAIKKKLQMFGEPRNWVKSEIQPILNTLIAAYHSVVSKQ